jgi:hypothetical protein
MIYSALVRRKLGLVRRKLGLVRRKLRPVLRLAQRCISNARKPSFWQEMGIRYLWRRPFWFTDKYGVTLRLYPEDGLKTILASPSHFDDESVLQLTKKLVKPGMTVIDVGANYGQFTIFAIQLVGSNGQVHAFEPTSTHFRG